MGWLEIPTSAQINDFMQDKKWSLLTDYYVQKYQHHDNLYLADVNLYFSLVVSETLNASNLPVIRYSADQWVSYEDVTGLFKSKHYLKNKPCDMWYFKLIINTELKPDRIEFALRQGEMWDNNHGDNYTLWL